MRTLPTATYRARPLSLARQATGETIMSTNVEWAVFRTPAPLAWRDFVWLSHQSYGRTADGRRVFVSVVESTKRAEKPDLYASRGFVRGNAYPSGYAFVATSDPSVWQVNYVVRIDPCGMVVRHAPDRSHKHAARAHIRMLLSY